MTPDTAALREEADAADVGVPFVLHSGYVVPPNVSVRTDTVRALCDAADEAASLKAQRAELLVEVGDLTRDEQAYHDRALTAEAEVERLRIAVAERDTRLAETIRYHDARVNRADEATDAARTAHAALVADLRALHFDDCGVCPVCTDDMLESVPFPCPTADALDAACAEVDGTEFIAHAREDVPFLLAEVERLRALADANWKSWEREAGEHARTQGRLAQAALLAPNLPEVYGDVRPEPLTPEQTTRFTAAAERGLRKRAEDQRDASRTAHAALVADLRIYATTGIGVATLRALLDRHAPEEDR